MARKIEFSASAAGAGPPAHVPLGSQIRGASLVIGGTFVAEARLEVSPNDVDWAVAEDQDGSPIDGITAAPSTRLVRDNAIYVRLFVTDYTSGTISATLLIRRDR